MTEEHRELAHSPEAREELARKITRSTLWTRIWIVCAIGFNAAVLGTLITVVFLIRYTQTEGSPSTKRLIAISEQISDCTTEGGKCAAEQAKSTGKVLIQIKAGTEDTVVRALICQERLHTTDEATLRACIKAQR